MLTLPPLPDGIDLLTDEQSDRIKTQHPSIPTPPTDCITCRGKKTFRWWEIGVPRDNLPVTYRCECTDQWVLHRYLLNAGIGTQYQRLGWADVQAEAGAVEKTQTYMSKADAYIHAGFGLIFYGGMGTGKTLLATLLLKDLLAQGYDGYFTTFSGMIDLFSAGWRDAEEKAFFYKRIKNAGVLVIDELGRERQNEEWLTKEARTERGLSSGVVKRTTVVAESSFDEVLRHRVANAKPTIITTNLDIAGIDGGYGSNIISLLKESSTTYRFTGEDFRKQKQLRQDEEVELGLTRPVVVG